MTERELIYTSVLNCARTDLYLQERPLKIEEERCILEILEKRKRGFPLPYILGKTEFMGLEFKVAPGVFIPRPETELLVEKTLDLAISHQPSAISLKILDIGTGSGCIAISLKKFLPDTDITAIDVSQEALELARENAVLNDVKINFLAGDLFSNYKLQMVRQSHHPSNHPERSRGTINYSLIVSNPPYIPTREIDTLQPEIKYEPRLALDGGEDGLGFYRRIIQDSPRYLKKNGFLIMEMGFGQRGAIEKIFQTSGNFAIIEVVKDYSNIDRVVVAKNKY